MTTPLALTTATNPGGTVWARLLVTALFVNLDLHADSAAADLLIFHTRVEGQFKRIVRHGESPRNYWWEVTAKDGTRSIFGGSPDSSGDSTTLTDDAGNIAMWALREVRDTHDNFVRCHNVRVADVGVSGGTVPGVDLYPKRITYTGQGKIEGRYSVTFIRDPHG